MNVTKMCRSILLLTIINGILWSLTSAVYAQDMFYILKGGSVELYNRQGIYQKSYPIPTYQDTSTSDLATDGVEVWFSYSRERNYIDRMLLANAPGAATISLRTVPGGFPGGVGRSGDTVYVSRHHIDDSIGNRIEMYSDSSGLFLDDFETGYHAFPGAISVSGQYLFVLTYSDDISVYSLGGDFIRQFDVNLFPGYSPGFICTDDNYLWVFWGENIGYAYDFSGNRVPSEDITFEGLTSHGAVAFGWGPDDPNIMTPESELDFGSVVMGESTTLDLFIENVGNEALTVIAAELSDSTNFTKAIPVPFTLPAGTSQTFTLTFTPIIMGIHDATLSLSSNDPDEALFNVALTGKGTSGRFYVDSSKSPGGNGLSWATAFDSINSAMASSEVLNNSEIWVHNGTYEPVTLSKQVDIFGGFYGNETSLNQRDWTANETIIDGGGVSRAVNITPDAANGLLDGFIIQNGYVENTPYAPVYGGGIEILGAPGFSLANNTIRNNSSESVGGGIYINYATVDGVLVDSDNISITNCVFSNNTARGTSDGGGIYSSSNGLHIRDSQFIGNTANAGGGVALRGYGSNVSATIERSIFGGNQVQGDGGGIYSAITLNLSDSLIHDNLFVLVGSGIYLNGKNSHIVNNTIVNNRTTSGVAGYGISLAYADSTVMANNIIWANGKMSYNTPIGINDNYIQVYNHASNDVIITFSTIQDREYGHYESGAPDENNNMRKLPGFVDIDGPDDDPATWEDNDYRLHPGSICIDYGNGDLASAEDLYHNPRFDDQSVYDQGIGTPTYVDIGSQERQSNTPMHFYVDSAAVGAGTGESWTDALPSLNDAVSMAVDGAEIWVRSGNYLLNAPLELNRVIRLYGGFSGTENSRDQRDWIANSTVIDGQHSVDHCLSIFADAIVDGFTITGGGVPGHYTSGGGISVEKANPIISNNTIRNNIAFLQGGGIFINEGPTTVIDSCAIIGNALFVVGSNCYGGGIALYGSDGATITNSIIAGNLSPEAAGGIYSYGGLTLMNNTIADNRAHSAGGILQQAGQLTITNSIVYGNTAFYGNTQIYKDTLDATFSTIQGGEIGTGNIDQPPVFVDASSWDDNGTPADVSDDVWTAGDYHLQWGSPSIDNGTATGAPVIDIELTTRPQSAGIDMGAYEIVPPVPGDVNGDKDVTLEDAILALKMITGQTTAEPVSTGGDVNNDQKIGVEEVMYILNN